MGQYLDFDKCDFLFYNNLYLEDIKMVIKMPISDELGIERMNNLRIEKFDLRNRVYLTDL